MSSKREALSGLATKVRNRVFRTFGIKRGEPDAGAPVDFEGLLAPLEPHFRAPLLSMYRGEPQLGTDGQRHPIDRITKINPSQGMWLYNFCATAKPKATLEIGMAYGYSTLYVLAAAKQGQITQHIAIDPFQNSYWHGIGLAHAQAVANSNGLQSVFRFLEDRSDRVAADLARAHSTFDVIFIDGNHRFDDVLVDFYLYAQICAMGGYIIFDDMWMTSIQTVVDFVRTNRKDFAEVPTTEHNICVFQRVGDDTRDWKHFQTFGSARGMR